MCPMMMMFQLLKVAFFMAFCLSASAQPLIHPFKIQESGNEPVERYSTAIRFYVNVLNRLDEYYNVTVTPLQCCLYIEEDDIDCEIMKLKHSAVLQLQSVVTELNGNNTGRAEFLFQNLYARYRKGNCSFSIRASNSSSPVWLHWLEFNTYPSQSENCTGIDEDPDRSCAPVDCAIKYKGRRNFFRNSTRKCEPVVECNTRAKDGSVNGYYDWDTNTCYHYEWMENENYVSMIESDAEIPLVIDPSSSKYFPDFEPHLLEKMEANSEYKLNCNHGTQVGILCVCDKGWRSSGIHHKNVLQYHWCDVRLAEMLPPVDYHAPQRLTKFQEVAIVILLLFINTVFLVLWVIIVTKQVCNRNLWRRNQGYSTIPTFDITELDPQQ